MNRNRQKTFFAAVLGMALLMSSCRPMAGPSALRNSGNVEQDAYAIEVFSYDTSLIMRTDPESVIDHFVRDLSWVEGISGAIDIRVPESESGKDMSRAGSVLNFDIRLMGLNFPCRMINLNYVPGEKLWLMIISGRSWLMWRIEFSPHPDGCRMDVNIIGRPSRRMGPLGNARPVVKAGSKRFDLILANAQASFDPETDRKLKLKEELQGELYTTLFQGYESSIWIDARPVEVMDWLSSNPDNISALLPMVELLGECGEEPGKLLSREGVAYCPAGMRLGDDDQSADVLISSFRERCLISDTYINDVWIVALELIMGVRITTEPKAGGSLIKIVVSTELPDTSKAEAMDLTIAISRIPEKAGEILKRAREELEE